LSTPIGQPKSISSWKQEVSRRVAAHQSRAALPTPPPATPAARTATYAQSRPEPVRRNAQIAARVAARYAQAPSYSQLHTEASAARTDVPDALPEPLAASAGVFSGEFEAIQAGTPLQPSTRAWESDVVPARPAAPPSLEASESQDSRPSPKPDQAPDFVLRPPEPVLSSHAKLIEFPRELVAPRKRRPRRAEGPFAPHGLERQLSIFEVDPGALSIEPGMAGVASALTRFELEAQPPAEEPSPEPQNVQASLPALRQASIGLRLTAALVDVALIAAAFLGAVLAAVTSVGHPFPAGIAKFSAIAGFLLAGLLYQAIFLILDNATPGMRCAGLFLYTLDGQVPTRAYLRRRLGALLLTGLSVGLGAAWVLFDEDRLSWHDRLSQTYLRKG